MFLQVFIILNVVYSNSFLFKENRPSISFIFRTCGLHLQNATKKITRVRKIQQGERLARFGKNMNMEAPTKTGSLFEESLLVSNNQWGLMKK